MNINLIISNQKFWLVDNCWSSHTWNKQLVINRVTGKVSTCIVVHLKQSLQPPHLSIHLWSTQTEIISFDSSSHWLYILQSTYHQSHTPYYAISNTCLAFIYSFINNQTICGHFQVWILDYTHLLTGSFQVTRRKLCSEQEKTALTGGTIPQHTTIHILCSPTSSKGCER